MLDTRTLLITLALNAIFLAAAQAFYLYTRKTYPGFRQWTQGTILLACGYLLLALRGAIPDVLSIFGGLLSMPATAIFILIGARRFFGLKSLGFLPWSLLLLLFGGLVWFYAGNDSPAWRGMLMSMTVTILGLPAAWLFWRHAPPDNRAVHMFTAGLLAIMSITVSVRAVVMLVHDPHHQLLSAHIMQPVNFLMSMVTQMGWVMGFIMMNNHRLETELTAASRNLEQARVELSELQGLVPICSWCKAVRKDDGYWEQVEHYVSQHYNTQFTHTLCPDCLKRYYPDLAEKLLARPKEGDKD